ncbi:MAG: type II toxin-antitoxin system RelE/ParE family toxin [Nitrospirota bacterium]
MAWEVKWAQAALDDLDTIANYIARDSPNYAAAFLLELLDAARSLAQLAERGRVVPEWHEQTTRELLVGNYRLIYQVAGPVVHVVGIVHGSRDLKALWEREGRRPLPT